MSNIADDIAKIQRAAIGYATATATCGRVPPKAGLAGVSTRITTDDEIDRFVRDLNATLRRP